MARSANSFSSSNSHLSIRLSSHSKSKITVDEIPLSCYNGSNVTIQSCQRNQIATSAYGLLAMTHYILVTYYESPMYNVIARKPAGSVYVRVG